MCFYKNTVTSVANPPALLVLLPDNQVGWCEQFSQEGYDVIHVTYPPRETTSLASLLENAQVIVTDHGSKTREWGLITYGLTSQDADQMLSSLSAVVPKLGASVHFCPDAEHASPGFLIRDSRSQYLPVTFHLASSQDKFHASILPLEDPANLGYVLPTHVHAPIKVYTYPSVSHSPPFPFTAQAPVQVTAGETHTVDAYILSARNLSLTRTLESIRRYLGPHFNYEKLWNMHTYYEFVERDAAKTMTTMVATPYVNHVPTMTGGVGYDNLARFYKHHFTKVTPIEFELVTVSRTIGADRIVDEMIFKCTHTMEMDYLLPGIPPTGKAIEIPMVGVIAFRGDKLCFEHLYWDQASVLIQLGKLDPTDLPIAGVEVARKVLDPFGQPSNTLMKRWSESESGELAK